MKWQVFALGIIVAVCGSLAPAPAYALYDGGMVKVCVGGYADGNYQVNCWWEWHGGYDGGGGGGYDPYDPYEGGGGGGGGSEGLTQVSDKYTIGTFHCDGCAMTDQPGMVANGTIMEFIRVTVDKYEGGIWIAPDGTGKNVIICNGDCFKYTYGKAGNWVRTS